MLSKEKNINSTTWSAPAILYKIVTAENWAKTKSSDRVWLDASDEKFIHFSTEDQWKDVAENKYSDTDWVLLKIDTTKLSGKWEWEWNTKQTDKWFHLYNGWIPKAAVIDWKKSWDPDWTELYE